MTGKVFVHVLSEFLSVTRHEQVFTWMQERIVVENVDWYSHCRNQFRGFLLTVKKKNGSVL